jgi:hypothetical protein
MIVLLPNIKSHLPKLLYFSVGTLILILLSSAIVTNEVYAQTFPNTQHSGVSNTSIAQPQQQQHQSSQKLHIVKITSPAKGQQVAAGKNLIVSGTSVDNTTSDCGVSIIVNGVKPYRLASAMGAGPKDYSNWNFTLTPAYTSIKQGQNKITAKFSCTNDPNLISHSSVNVTGVGTSLAPIATQQKQQNTGKNSTTTNVNTTSTGNAISPVTPSSSPHPNVANTTNSTNNGSMMSVSIHLAKKSVQPGDKQSVIIKVTDSNSTFPVVGASVLGKVKDPSGGLFKKLEGTTDDTGKSSYSWTVSQVDTPGKYNTMIGVSAHGYKNNTASKTFQVIPVTTTTTSNNSLIHLSPNANSSNDSHKNSPSTIIPIPHIRIPTIKIPFHLPFQ